MIDALEQVQAELDMWTDHCPIKRDTGVWTCLDIPGGKAESEQCPACRSWRLVGESVIAVRSIDDDPTRNPHGVSLTKAMNAARVNTYKRVLIEHGGVIRDAAPELGLSREALSRSIDQMGLRPWLDATWPHRDPATKGRKGNRRRGATKRKTKPIG